MSTSRLGPPLFCAARTLNNLREDLETGSAHLLCKTLTPGNKPMLKSPMEVELIEHDIEDPGIEK